MRHWTCVFTHGDRLHAVANVTELGDGRFNVAIVTNRARARFEPGNWTVIEAQEQAERWAEELLGGREVVGGMTVTAAVPSRRLEGQVEP